MTGLQRVAAVARQARAGGGVVNHPALGVQAARAGTRVHALVVDARAVTRAVRVHDTLGPAARVRVARVLGQAGARARAVAFFAHGVGAARRRVARLTVLLLGRRCKAR